MNDYKKELQKVEELFKRCGQDGKLNVAEEFLYMYIGVIKDDGSSFTDSLVKRMGLSMTSIDEFVEEYTVEIGAIISMLLQDISQIVEGGKSVAAERMPKIAQDIFSYLDTDKKSFLKRVAQMLQDDLKLLSKSKLFKGEIKKMFEQIEAQSELFSLDVSVIDTLEEEHLPVIVILVINEVFGVLGLIQMQMQEDGNLPELITEKEYAEDGFDLREKLREVIDGEGEIPAFDTKEFVFYKGERTLCNLCDCNYTQSGLQRHISSCVVKKLEDKTVKSKLYYFKIYDKYMPEYYLHIVVSRATKLFHIDRFLREIWLECCGHMSGFMAKRREINMGEPVEVLVENKKTDYTYDFGSSTELVIEFKKEFQGKQKNLIQLVAMNAMLEVKCHKCHKKVAEYICSECLHGGDEVVVCKTCVQKHAKEYHEGETYPIMYLENSPRTGVCGYGVTEEEF